MPLGGLRNPNQAVARSLGLRTTGTQIRRILEGILDDPACGTEIHAVVAGLGQPEAVGFSNAIVDRARADLRAAFGITEPFVEGLTRFDHELWEPS